MSTLSPQMKRLCIAMSIALLSVGAYGSTMALLSALRGALAEEKAALESARMVFERRESLRLLAEEVSGTQAALSTWFVKPGEAVTVLERIEQTALASGVDADILSVEEGQMRVAREEGAHAALVLSLEATGSFEGLYRFSKRLEHFPFAASISHLALERTEGEEGPWTLRARLLFPFHYRS